MIWWLFETKKISFYEFKLLFFILCIVLAISITGWRIGTDYRFYQFQIQFSEQLKNCQGYVSFSEVRKTFRAFQPASLKHFIYNMDHPSEHIINKSIFYPNSFKVKAVIQSNAKPPWFCLDFTSSKSSFIEYEKTNFQDFITISCRKNINIEKIIIQRFDFSPFIQAVKSKKSFCKQPF